MSIFAPAPAPEPEPTPGGSRLGTQWRRASQVWNGYSVTTRFVVIVAAAALVPVVFSSAYIVRVGVNTIIYALLALGLNVVVGWAGLLDLGYVAFFGFGAYLYAVLSSNQFHLHWPAVASVPVVVAASALLGLIVGLPSRRLLGDYLAILTLFFGQAFITFVSNADRITPPGYNSPVNFTGGPNGIPGVDNINSFGLTVVSVQGYYYLSLALFVVVTAGLYSLNHSRTGRAWRSLREDPLAAELMGMPVNRLKILAFVFGAATAGLTGTVFAALQVGVFPGNFEIQLLILIYAMVILGGAGSMTGVVLGAVTVNIVLEILRTPDPARYVFYGLIAAALLTWVRPYRRLAYIILGAIAFGALVHFAVTRLDPGATTSEPPGGGLFGRLLSHWVVYLAHPTLAGNIAYVGLLVSVVLLSQLKGRWRTIALVPTLYLAAFVWENALVTNPSVARLIILGAMLITLMNARPQGLLGTSRIEIA